MPSDDSPRSPIHAPHATEPSDDFFVSGVLAGDEAALRALIARYDRLVRFTVFRMSKARCLQDPQWLESVASATWTGFVRSMQRASGNRPRSLRAYIAAVARNQVASALRGAPNPDDAAQSIDELANVLTATPDEPIETLSQLELLEALRLCLSQLGDDDRTLASQLTAIMERRWRDAAAALRMSESTLRSRWKRTLDRLRNCIEGQTGLRLAPKPSDDDS